MQRMVIIMWKQNVEAIKVVVSLERNLVIKKMLEIRIIMAKNTRVGLMCLMMGAMHKVARMRQCMFHNPIICYV